MIAVEGSAYPLMRVLWVSDSPDSPSGFGAVTGAVCRRLAQRGHHVEILGWQTHGSVTRWEGIPVRPVRRDAFGADVLLGYLMRMRPDFVITLGDVWWMSFMTDPPVQRYLDAAGARWVLYYPIDGCDESGGLPDGWRRVLHACDVPVAMSRFGVEVSETCGVAAAYIPHGCDCELFRPPADKQALKRTFGYDGSFVVLSDARNQPRKLLPRTIEVAATCARKNADVIFHLHCDPDDDAADSDLYTYRLREDVAAMGLDARVRFTPAFRMRSGQGLPLEELARLYQAADAHLLCSWGEGFGLPNLQAAAAGVVPIAVAETASRELVDGHGFAIPAESAVIDEFGLERHFLSIAHAAAAIERLVGRPDELAARARAARGFALTYDWDLIADMWERVLAAAAPRRKPERSQVLHWVAGESPIAAGMPEAVVTAAGEAFAPLPGGTEIRVHVTERQMGEVAVQIRRDAFRVGDEMSLPVRLRPFFDGAPRPRIGNIMAAPADLPVLARLVRVFPNIHVQLPAAGGNPQHAEPLPLEDLIPAIAHCAAIIDSTGWGPRHLDLACAALGVPFIGESWFWPPPVTSGGLFHQLRRLLTDQGLSERRREVAAQRATELCPASVLTQIRQLALPDQPERDEQRSVSAA